MIERNIKKLWEPLFDPVSVRPGMIIRQFEDSDTEEYFALVKKNRPYLREHLTWLDQETLEQAKDFIRSTILGFRARKKLICGIFKNGKLIGTIGFREFDTMNNLAAVGYWLDCEYQGDGIMTDCVRKLFDYGFDHFGLNRIELCCDTSNIASQTIAQKLGMVYEGTQRSAVWFYDHYKSIHGYSILKNEWNPRSDAP